MRAKHHLILFLIGFSFLSGCASTPTAEDSFADASAVENLEEDENRFWLMSDSLDQELRNLNVLYDDPELDQYLQATMDKLFPDFIGKIRIHAIKDASLNAFAMANGSVYMNIGMLARLDNEAELATILAHEGIHFTDRHVVHGMRQAKSTSVFSQILGMGGIGLVGGIVGASSVSGFSQSLESSADLHGFSRLRDAEYDVAHAANSFARFAREIAAVDDSKGSWFFASHPKMEERAKSFNLLKRTVRKGGHVGADNFLAHTMRARMDALTSLVEKNEYVSVIHILETEDRLSLYPPEAQYYLAEAYRLKDEEGDKDRAMELYKSTIQNTNDFAPPHARLGFLQMKNQENKLALDNFEKYIQLDPKAKDRAYIEQYIETIKGAQP